MQSTLAQRNSARQSSRAVTAPARTARVACVMPVAFLRPASLACAGQQRGCRAAIGRVPRVQLPIRCASGVAHPNEVSVWWTGCSLWWRSWGLGPLLSDTRPRNQPARLYTAPCPVCHPAFTPTFTLHMLDIIELIAASRRPPT